MYKRVGLLIALSAMAAVKFSGCDDEAAGPAGQPPFISGLNSRCGREMTTVGQEG